MKYILTMAQFIDTQDSKMSDMLFPSAVIVDSLEEAENEVKNWLEQIVLEEYEGLDEDDEDYPDQETIDDKLNSLRRDAETRWSYDDNERAVVWRAIKIV